MADSGQGYASRSAALTAVTRFQELVAAAEITSGDATWPETDAGTTEEA